MWSKWPWVSSTRRTLSRWHNSSSSSCSLAASISSDSPVWRHLTTNTLLSYEPTTTLWTSASAFDQCSVLEGEAMRSVSRHGPADAARRHRAPLMTELRQLVLERARPRHDTCAVRPSPEIGQCREGDHYDEHVDREDSPGVVVDEHAWFPRIRQRWLVGRLGSER